MCVYYAMQDGSWGLTFTIFYDHGIQAFNRDDAAWESNFCSEPCLAVSIPKILELFSSTSHKIPLDGSELMSINVSRWASDKEVDNFLQYVIDYFPSSSGAQPALPMGVALEAIIKFVFRA
jgi:hypothetical protein